MEVILIQDVETLGYKNDLVSVKSGYARNYLIPKGYAKVANSSNMKVLDEIRKQEGRKEEQLLNRIADIKKDLAKAEIKIGAKTGTTEKIFGSVTTHHIAEAIKEKTGIAINRRKIVIVEGEVKSIGNYKAKIDLHPDHDIEVDFEVVPE
ncbi:MAG: 50S ribosomal protein L9 [Chitinophagales bacterium]|nr:50S ribosomal protein L9 [Chitinophagales bacterium]